MAQQRLLSGSTSGEPISITATAIGSSPTTIHTAYTTTNTSTAFDSIWLWATNVDTGATHTLTLGHGADTAGATIVMQIPPASVVLVMGGVPLNNTLVLNAAVDVTAKINVFGFINTLP